MALVAGLYGGLAALLLVALSLRVSLMRLSGGVSAGDGGDRRLARAIRLQANLTEYAPLAMLLILLLELQGAPDWALHLSGGTFLLGRLLHGAGFSREPQHMGLRKWGMVVTYAMLTGAGSACIAYALGWIG